MSARIRQRDIHGFTVIELVLAIAITAILATCVYSATQSMSATARRQKDVSSQQSRRDRFEEIVRRDLRGWLPSKSAQSTKPTESSDVLSSLQFNTSADSLSGTISASPTPMLRSTAVQYIVHKVGDSYEFERLEMASGNAQFKVVLFRSTAEMVIEFFDGSKWLPGWTGNDRPKAIRIAMGDDGFVVRP
jgi:prepilin-type N-terminal cleavage/methylation domain-containing protein